MRVISRTEAARKARRALWLALVVIAGDVGIGLVVAAITEIRLCWGT